MAVSTTDKALNLCSRLSDAADRLMKAVEDLENLRDEKESGGLNLTAAAVETALGASSLKHASGTNFNSVLSSSQALKAWLAANFHDDVLSIVRP